MFVRIASLTGVSALIGGVLVGFLRLNDVRNKTAVLNRVDTGSVW